MKKIINIVIVLAVIAGAILILRMNKKANTEETNLATTVSAAIPVQLAKVEATTYSTEFVSNGIIEPESMLTLVAEVSGKIENIHVDKGNRVTAGQLLLSMEDELLEADYKASKTTFEALKKDYERISNAAKSGGVSEQQMDNIHTQMIAAESRYISSRKRLEDASVKAPVSGLINQRYVEVGGYLNPGSRLFDLVNDSSLKLKTSVSSSMVIKLAVGQQVTVRCDVLPGKDIMGKITFIGALADRGLSYPVEIMIEKERELKAGMYASVIFHASEESKGLLIPRNAISGSVKNASVYVVNKGIASRRDVIVGEMIGKEVEILSGLQEGDSIVVAGLINVSDGVQVINKN